MAHRISILLLCLLSSACNRRSSDTAGSGGGSTVPPGPRVLGLARFYDVNRSGTADAGDRIVVPFDNAVRAAGSDASALRLSAAGDALGQGATLVSGPMSNEITALLGNGAALKTRQSHVLGQDGANAASGIDIALGGAANIIEDAATGADATPSAPIDVAPGLVPGPSLASGAVGAAAAGDLDRDGALDLVLARADGGFEVWLGVGDGSFSGGATLGDRPAASIALADVDRDGRLDVVLGTEVEDQVWRGTGDGNFVEGASLAPSEPTRALAAVDLDGDGDLDLVGAGRDALRVRFNDGQGAFGAVVSHGTGAAAVACADVDRDGDLDVLAAGQAAVVLWKNDGLGGLTEAALLGSTPTQALALADVDLDGDLDLFAAGDGVGRLWRGDGSGAFDLAAELPGAPGAVAVGAIFADIDQDARPDLVVSDAEGALVWLNTPAGFARLERIDMPQLAASAGGDFDGDGDGDFVLATVANGARAFAGSLRGTWGSATLVEAAAAFGGGPTRALAAGDVDRDGDSDVAAGKDPVVEVFANEREELFGDRPLRLSVIAGAVRDLALVDVDRDGDLDLLALRREGFFTFLGDGAGGFAGLESVPSGESALESAFSLALAVGDVDRDGDPDVIVGNLAGVDALVPNLGHDERGWLGFGPAVRLPQGAPVPERTRTTDVALADLDLDGDLDLAITQASARPDLIYLNDGSGNFSAAVQALGAGSSRALAAFDLDFDGDVDLATATDEDGVLFWINDGTGRFDAGGSLASGAFLNLALRDLDGDRYPELVALRAGPNGPATFLWHNDAGAFASPVELATGTSTAQLDDFDLDGDVDLALGFEEPDLSGRPWWNR